MTKPVTYSRGISAYRTVLGRFAPVRDAGAIDPERDTPFCPTDLQTMLYVNTFQSDFETDEGTPHTPAPLTRRVRRHLTNRGTSHHTRSQHHQARTQRVRRHCGCSFHGQWFHGARDNPQSHHESPIRFGAENEQLPKHLLRFHLAHAQHAMGVISKPPAAFYSDTSSGISLGGSAHPYALGDLRVRAVIVSPHYPPATRL